MMLDYLLVLLLNGYFVWLFDEVLWLCVLEKMRKHNAF